MTSHGARSPASFSFISFLLKKIQFSKNYVDAVSSCVTTFQIGLTFEMISFDRIYLFLLKRLQHVMFNRFLSVVTL